MEGSERGQPFWSTAFWFVFVPTNPTRSQVPKLMGVNCPAHLSKNQSRSRVLWIQGHREDLPSGCSFCARPWHCCWHPALSAGTRDPFVTGLELPALFLVPFHIILPRLVSLGTSILASNLFFKKNECMLFFRAILGLPKNEQEVQSPDTLSTLRCSSRGSFQTAPVTQPPGQVPGP